MMAGMGMAGGWSETEMIELREFILFAKAEKIPSFKLGDFECTLPPRDATESELLALRKEVDALKAICNRLILAVETRETSRATPFTNRINLAGKNG